MTTHSSFQVVTKSAHHLTSGRSRTGREHAAKILALCARVSNRNMETEHEKEKSGFTSCQTKGEHNRLAPRKKKFLLVNRKQLYSQVSLVAQMVNSHLPLYLFIFLLPWVSVVPPRLSSCSVWGLISGCRVQVSVWVLLLALQHRLWSTRGFSTCSSQALSSCGD